MKAGSKHSTMIMQNNGYSLTTLTVDRITVPNNPQKILFGVHCSLKSY